SEVLSYEEPDIIGYPNVDKIGRAGLPERRISWGLTWDIEAHMLNVNWNHIASTAEETEDANDEGTKFKAVGELSSYNIIDVNYTYATPWNLDLTVGVNNLADKDPVLNSELAYDDTLYSQVGRLYYAGFKFKF
ncbi:MAG: hypothetical protein AAGK05_06820, partial [Pseudomonadota bacterium]